MLGKLNKKRDQQGFTLIELMIVIAIIGILAAIAIPQFTAYRERAHRAATISDAKNAYTAVQAYLADNPDVAPDDIPAENIEGDSVGDKYTGLRTSSGVTIDIAAGGPITATNTNLAGSYEIDAETGEVDDTLGEAGGGS